MWGTWYIISPLSEKEGGRVSRVPHLIAPMVVHNSHILSNRDVYIRDERTVIFSDLDLNF